MEPTDLYIYPNTIASIDALLSFNMSLAKLTDDSLINKLKSINNRIFNLIAEFDLEKFYISITSSDSVFYRFKLQKNDFEFKWEVYDDESDVESILHIYNNGLKEKSTFGSIAYIYDIINDKILSTDYAEAVNGYTPLVYGEAEYDGIPYAISA